MSIEAFELPSPASREELERELRGELGARRVRSRFDAIDIDGARVGFTSMDAVAMLYAAKVCQRRGGVVVGFVKGEPRGTIPIPPWAFRPWIELSAVERVWRRLGRISLRALPEGGGDRPTSLPEARSVGGGEGPDRVDYIHASAFLADLRCDRSVYRHRFSVDDRLTRRCGCEARASLIGGNFLGCYMPFSAVIDPGGQSSKIRAFFGTLGATIGSCAVIKKCG